MDYYPKYTKLNNKKASNLIKKWARDLNRHLTKQDMWVANNHMKDAPHHMSSENSKIKQHDSITYLLEWSKSETLTSNIDENVVQPLEYKNNNNLKIKRTIT